MKIIAAVHADFERTFLGLPARLNTDLHGETVIRRTLKQLSQTAGLSSIHLLVDASQEAAGRAAVAGMDVTVETHSAGPPPWTTYVASGRKWSLDAWRGGLAGTMVYDEFNHPWLLEALLGRERAGAVIDVPAAAPLLDPRLLEAHIAHYAKVREEARLAVVQSAPGLSAVIYGPELLANLAKIAQPPGRAMAYRPDDPQHDAINQPCWYPAEATICHGWGRCIADTDTAMARLDHLLTELAGPNADHVPDALSVSRWLRAHRDRRFDLLPREVEIEITTRDALPESLLRPRGEALGRKGEMSFEVFKRIIDELATRDDRLIVLGGFGDPLAHPQWAEFVRYARDHGILGIALRTSGVYLSPAAIDDLVESGLDVLNITVDAATPETYRKLNQADCFDQVTTNIDQLCNVQQQRQRPRPLIACEMVKTRETMDELEAFYDRWIRKTASAVLAGPSHYAGEWPDRSVVRMAPPTRFACLRVGHRALVLADGRMTLCDQDFRGRHAVGSLAASGLAELWEGKVLADVRQKQFQGRYDGLPLCCSCDEWHRP